MKAILTIIIAILLSNSVLALGIAPAKKTIDFEPEGSVELSYRIYNSDKQDFTAKIELDDSLSDIATVEPSQIAFKADDVVKPFRIKITFGKTPPKQLDGKITITSVGNRQAPVSASVQISSTLNIRTTGAVTAEPEAKKKKDSQDNSFMNDVLVVLIVVLVGGNLMYFLLNKKQTPKESPERPIPATENKELESAREIENEIQRLRELR